VVLVAVVQPLVAGGDDWRSFDVFLSVLIVAVSQSLLEEKGHRRKAVALAAVAITATWLSTQFADGPERALLILGYLSAACFFGFALYGILANIMAKSVSAEAIFGAVCGYLLLGIIWGLAYSSLEAARPGSFQIAATPATGDGAPSDGVPAMCHGVLTYYSLVTLTTVGYGDVTPTTPAARTLSWLEAVTGQFYLAVLVAGLVALRISQARGGESPEARSETRRFPSPPS
jgi:hypothetical protein